MTLLEYIIVISVIFGSTCIMSCIVCICTCICGVNDEYRIHPEPYVPLRVVQVDVEAAAAVRWVTGKDNYALIVNPDGDLQVATLLQKCYPKGSLLHQETA